MFTFLTRVTLRLGLVVLSLTTGWVALTRLSQPDFPPILYGDTTTLQLYLTRVGCEHLTTPCTDRSRFLLDSLYTFPVGLWSPDGQFIAVHHSESWLIYPADCLLVVQTCAPAELPDAAGDVRLAWGPDGAVIASYANTSAATLTLHTRGCWDTLSPCLETTIPLSQSSLLTEPAWSADGSRMAFVDYLGTGLVWFDTACFDRPQGCESQLRIVGVGANRVSWPSLSPDGRTAILTMDTRGDNTRHQMFQVELDTGAVQQLTNPVGTASYPAWSADGRYILFAAFPQTAASDLQIFLIDTTRRLTLPVVHHLGRDVAFASWGPRP